MHDRRDAGRGIYDRRGAGHEEFTIGGMPDIRNAQQEGCRT